MLRTFTVEKTLELAGSHKRAVVVNSWLRLHEFTEVNFTLLGLVVNRDATQFKRKAGRLGWVLQRRHTSPFDLLDPALIAQLVKHQGTLGA